MPCDTKSDKAPFNTVNPPSASCALSPASCAASAKSCTSDSACEEAFSNSDNEEL